MGAEPLLALRLSLALGPLRLEAEAQARGSTGIVGPSGAGKSTLLRILAGLERRARGQVRAFGETWQDEAAFVPPWRRGVGYAPQEPRLFPHANVRQNLGWTAPPAALLDEVAALLELTALLDRAPRNLSGGEQQRVALGRALCARPRLLLLDEPFSALDRPLRARLSRALGDHCRARALPVLLVSHDADDVEALCDERWRLAEGRLVAAPGA